MKNDFYNEFNLSEELSRALSALISKMEGIEYVCRVVSITIPEHRGSVFRSPLAGEIHGEAGLML